MTKKEKDLLEALVKVSNKMVNEITRSFNNAGYYTGGVKEETLNAQQEALGRLLEDSNYLK